jgi:hypothetical protein
MRHLNTPAPLSVTHLRSDDAMPAGPGHADCYAVRRRSNSAFVMVTNRGDLFCLTDHQDNRRPCAHVQQVQAYLDAQAAMRADQIWNEAAPGRSTSASAHVC